MAEDLVPVGCTVTVDLIHGTINFEHEQFGELRTMEKDGEIWVAGVDACRILEIKNPRDAMSRLDDDEKMLIELVGVSKNGVTNSVGLTDGYSGAVSKGWIKNEITFVNEPGFWRLIFASRTKKAREIQRWAYHEVFPSIRKYGYYAMARKEPEYITVTRNEKVYIPYIFIPKYYQGRLVFVPSDLKAFCNVSEFRLKSAIKNLKVNWIDGDYIMLRGKDLKNFLADNAISNSFAVLPVYSKAAAMSIFEHFKVKLPAGFDKVSEMSVKFDNNVLCDFINGYYDLKKELDCKFDKFVDEFIVSGAGRMK